MHKNVTLKRVGWALVILGGGLLLVWGVSLGWTVLSLRSHLAEVSAWAEAPEEVDPAAACQLVTDVRRDVVALERRAGGLVRLAPILGWLPGVGDELRAAPDLLVVADGLTEAGAIGCEAAQAVLESPGNGGGSTTMSPEHLLNILEENQPALEQARVGVERAQEAWKRVDAESLSPSLRDKATLLDLGLPLMRSGLSAAAAAPDLLGANGPRTYLVLALNEDELRPGGGFISGVGEIHIDAGKLITMTFRDSYAVDDFSQPYPDAPEPMQRYMGIDLLVFRDSNWSPDFPTAAQQAIDLYRPGYPVSIDGVVALDQEAVRELIGAVDPVVVEGAEEPVTSETILTHMHEAWAPGQEDWTLEWLRQRKSFMGAIASAAWERVEEGQVDWAALARSLLRLLEEKHLLAYVPDPTVSQMLAEQSWDGALRPAAGDFLMVVDANVGYNKASAKVDEEILYEVDLRESPPQARLTLTYTHTSSADATCHPETRYAVSYEGMMDRCYWNYIRVYVREGSELVDATRIPVPPEAVWAGEGESGEVTVKEAAEGPWVTFGVLGLIPPSTIQTRTFTWTLPPDVVEWADETGRYSLLVQKQPGTEGHPLSVRVRLPEGGAVVDAGPQPWSMEDGWVVYRTALDEDVAFDLEFEEGR